MEQQINIIAFGNIAQITGNNFLMTGINNSADLIKALEDQFPQLKTTPYALAADKKIINNPIPLPNLATVALLPPFSGG